MLAIQDPSTAAASVLLNDKQVRGWRIRKIPQLHHSMSHVSMPLWSPTKVSLSHVRHSSDLNKFPSPFISSRWESLLTSPAVPPCVQKAKVK